ncbi:phosphotransferase [Pseudoalteromonas sp. McH1-7]|nr:MULTISPECIES: phosphotransferase [Pseudoalteromonas]MDW7551538.1 phosphotransferase [Pseudoalteromonas peptidolytica]NLR16711.1 phosphotransferase [Pseudoalteromonas peptidolytica]NUZ13133.1 phosphotransferase [Pseudoalteromonas sp. McH1-7]USD28490.1 phosphotransferase [Pseudoalteromonas sp. SCSIO 43201]
MMNIPSTEVVQKAYEMWLGVGDSVCISQSENFIYSFTQHDKDYVLRLTPSEKKQTSLYDAEMKVLNYLASHNVKTCQPAESKFNRLLEQVCVKADESCYIASAFVKLVGEQVEIADVDSELLFQWGELLGSIHKVGCSMSPEQFKRPTEASVVTDVKNLLNDCAVDIDDELRLFIQSEIEWLSNLPMNSQNYGLNHGDLAVNNLIKTNNQLYAIDFDSCHFCHFIIDVALAIRASVGSMSDLNKAQRERCHQANAKHFLSGYHTQHPLDNIEVESIARVINLIDCFEYLILRYRYFKRQSQQEAHFTMGSISSEKFEQIASDIISSEQLLWL